MPRATGINPPDAAKPAPRVAPPTESATTVPAAGSQSSTSDALVIYVNCMPVRGVSGVTNLSDEIAKRTAEIVTAHGAADLNSKPLDFGRGLGLLADSFRDRPLTGPVLATQGGLSTRILETLEPLAAVVVKGVA